MTGMLLRSTLTSPFGRKVRMAAAVLGLGDAITIEPADTLDEADTLRAQNPLGKIPALILADGTVLYDSRTIVEFLDATAGPLLYPAEPLARARTQTAVALCDGVTDAALLLVYESRFRHNGAMSERWVAHQRGKLARGLTAATALADGLERLDAAAISLVAALGYLDWRHGGRWRTDYPRLAAWLEAIAAREPAVRDTNHQEATAT